MRAAVGWGILFASLVAAPAHALDAAAVAPLPENEFYTFFDEYRAFADCIDALARKSGLTGEVIGKNLSESGKAQDLIAQAETIILPDSPFHAQIHSARLSDAQRVQVAVAALIAEDRTAGAHVNHTRHLVLIGMARLFAAQASDGSCGPSKQFMTLFDKARKQ